MTFDWPVALTRDGRNDGLIFQEICRKLFESEGYYVRVCSEGGGDFGRDLEVTRKSDIGFSGHAESWVECKSRVSNSAVNVKELGVNLICAVVEQIPRLIFITNFRIANDTRTAIQKFNFMTPPIMKTSTIEKEQLEGWIAHHPEIYVEYFAPGADRDSYEKPTTPNPVALSCTLTSHFMSDDPQLIAEARNSTFVRKNVVVDVCGRSYRISLEPLDEVRQVIPAVTNEDLRPRFWVEDQPVEVRVANAPDALTTRIDHIFVDPNDDTANILRAMSRRTNLFLSGAAGMGKSRVMREAARRCDPRPLTIDLSFLDYRYSLAEHLVMSMLDFDLPMLEAIGHDIISAVLRRSGCDLETADVVTRFIRHEPIGSSEAIVNAIVGAFERTNGGRYLFLDNIHRLSIQDLHIFERLLQQSEVRIVCAGRSHEIEVPATRSFLDSQMQRDAMTLLELEDLPIRRRLEAYLDAIASDNNCRAFLNRYRNSRSFHEFLLTLKELRIGGVIEQDAHGRIVLSNRDALTDTERAQGYAALVTAIVGAYGERSEQLLRRAAVYGFTFPHTYIADTMGASALPLIDQLVRAEILVSTDKHVAGIAMIRFDHELTRDLVYAALGVTERLSRHGEVIAFITRLGPSQQFYVPRELSRHYEQTHDLPQAVLFSNEDARLRVAESRLGDAWEAYERSWRLVRTYAEDRKLVAPPLQTETLEQMIPVGLRVLGPRAMKPYIGSMAINLISAPDELRSATVEQFNAVVFGDDYDYPHALTAIDRALEIYKRNHADAAYAQALNTKGVLLKQSNASPLATLVIHRDALRVFRKLNDSAGIAEALGDLGAVLLECRLRRQGPRAINTRRRCRERKTVFWWRRSAEVLKRAADHVRLCFHQIDYSYIYALFHPEADDAELQLRAALELARRLDLPLYICRALLNYANYLAIGCPRPRLAQAMQMIDESLQRARALDDPYLAALAILSVRVFRLASGEAIRRPDAELMRAFEDHCLTALTTVHAADARLMNFARFMGFHFSEARRHLRHVTDPLWLPFQKKMSLDDLARIEDDNPFYCGRGLYVTYY